MDKGVAEQLGNISSSELSSVQTVCQRSSRIEKSPDVYERHPEFHQSLDNGPLQLLEGLEQRPYQSRALEAIREGFLNGNPHGQMILGTGAGKTTVAVNLVAQTKGKVLWLAPSNTALQRAIDEFNKLQVGKKFQVLNGERIDDDTDIIFSTSQMMLANRKYNRFHPNHFSLIISDEAHHAMGPVTREIFDHFTSFQLYMTATPETTVRHLDNYATPFYSYSSDELIRTDGYPPWVLRRYEVQDEKIYEAKVYGDNYVIEDGEEATLLNMPHRYAICLQILRENIQKGEKTIVFMPSVASSRYFVEEIAGKDPLLKGKIFHVDGKMDRGEIRELADEYADPSTDQLAACCNAIWTESLDIKDIKHVVLCDPCCSTRIMMQRIGRGARPAEGKTHLTVHDVVSVIENTEAVRSKTLPLSVSGLMGMRVHEDGIVLNGPKRGKKLFEVDGKSTQKVQYIECTDAEVQELPFSERMIDLGFISVPEQAVALYKRFATLLDTSLSNLIYRGEQFLNREEEMYLKYPNGKTCVVIFKDIFDAVKFFGVDRQLEQAASDDLDALCVHFGNSIREVVEDEKQLPADPFDPARLETLPFCSKQEYEVFRMIFQQVQKMKTDHEYLEITSGLSTRWKVDSEKAVCPILPVLNNKVWANIIDSSLINNIYIEGDEKNDAILVGVKTTREEWDKIRERDRDREYLAPKLRIAVRKKGKTFIPIGSFEEDDSTFENDYNIRLNYERDKKFVRLFHKLVRARLKGHTELLILQKDWNPRNSNAISLLVNVITDGWQADENGDAKYLLNVTKKGEHIAIPIGHIDIEIMCND